MYLGNFFYNSYYIKAGRESFYIKCFDTGQWIQCRSEFEVDEDWRIQKIHIDSGNFEQFKNNPLQVTTKKMNPFSHPRTVLHRFELAEQFIRHLIQRLKTGWWTSTQIFIFQLDYVPEGDITDIELRAIRDLLEHAGAKEIYIIKPEISVSEQKVDALYQQVSQRRLFKRRLVQSKVPFIAFRYGYEC